MNCPKCNSEMGTVRFADVEVDRCRGCGGLWFDMLEHEDLKKIKGAARVLDTGDSLKGSEMDQIEKVKCPKCETGMIRLHVPDQPHIIIDQCPVCDGVYMDAGEFKDFSDHTVMDFWNQLLS